MLDLLVDETLLRSTRSRKKTKKAHTNYTIANIPIATIKAFTAIVISIEPRIVILKTIKEL